MKSGSWSSYVAAGALGDGGGPDDDEPGRVDTTPDPFEEMREAGYRAYRDAPSGGRWIVAKCDGAAGLPIGEALGGGATAVEAWDAARRRFYAGHRHARACYDDAGPGAGGLSLVCGKTEG